MACDFYYADSINRTGHFRYFGGDFGGSAIENCFTVGILSDSGGGICFYYSWFGYDHESDQQFFVSDSGCSCCDYHFSDSLYDSGRRPCLSLC